MTDFATQKREKIGQMAGLAKIGTIGALAMGTMLSTILGAGPAGADATLAWSTGTHGTPGVIDMPAAGAMGDGEVSATIFARDGSLRSTYAFQITPRITANVRMAREKGLGATGGTKRDRSVDLHFQVIDEAGWRPAVAVGLRALAGDSVHSSEYIVASKTLTPRLRATAGIGWGRLGTEGDIGGGTRPALDTNGGTNEDVWFRGPFAPFAGIEYAATDKLTLKAEISSDAYAAETAAVELDRKTSLNFGAEYRFNKMAAVSAYYLYGDRVGLQFTATLDPRQPAAPSGLERAPLPVRPRPALSADAAAWSGDWAADPSAQPAIQGAVAEALRKDGQVLDSMRLSATAVDVRVRNQTYPSTPQAIGHTARILTRALPASVETITVTPVVNGLPGSAVTFKRSDLETMENGPSTQILAATTVTEAARGEGFAPTEGLYPRYQFSVGPYAEFSSFDPDQDLHADMGLRLRGRTELAAGWVLSGSVKQKLFGNLDEQTLRSTSGAPHVRSDLPLYQEHGDAVLETLQLAWYARPGENLYSRVSLGYLERMYGGVSGEMLWKPVDSRLALGAELNYVRQREFDGRLGFQDYDTLSGHVSAYYDFGAGVTGQLDVGRYLAEDWGATVAIDRRLANGWSVGAFATVTDMDAEDFGRGSFDKGVRLTIPLAWATGKPTQATFNPVLRPHLGDGGARVNVEGRLYETVRDTHMGALYEDWGRFWR
ncbi:MAG: YjbH domain-containing protein [Sphingomonadales bacterium]|nr:YjbH domain-containing protein [Sphingomonadales bacterium]